MDAAMNVWALRLFGAITGDAEALFLRLLTLARAQYGAELAHDRLRVGGPTPEGSPLEQLNLTLTRAADVHAFLVSAALYWATLRETVNHVPKPDLRPLFADYEKAAKTAKTAREHIEHLNERIRIGRRKEYGPVMPNDVFRKAVGAFDGERITFGDESFPIDGMLRAIRESSSAIAPRLRQATEPNLEVRTTAPENDPPSESD